MPDSPTAPAEPDPDPDDDLERELTDAFGPVDRWWFGELPETGLMFLPLP